MKKKSSIGAAGADGPVAPADRDGPLLIEAANQIDATRILSSVVAAHQHVQWVESGPGGSLHRAHAPTSPAEITSSYFPMHGRIALFAHGSTVPSCIQQLCVRFPDSQARTDKKVLHTRSPVLTQSKCDPVLSNLVHRLVPG